MESVSGALIPKSLNVPNTGGDPPIKITPEKNPHRNAPGGDKGTATE